ncbi:hypothetical protein BHE74_00002080 [Ensete ventricosum]|nr:hypothetical protein BHE74_00002080 [Ensete ventricosum]
MYLGPLLTQTKNGDPLRHTPLTAITYSASAVSRRRQAILIVRQCRVARRQAAHRVARLGPGRSTLSRYTLLLVGPPLHSFACRRGRSTLLARAVASARESD